MAIPYTVEPNTRGACDCCGHGTYYDIIGTDDVALGRSFSDKDAAEDYASELSFAFEKGEAEGARVARELVRALSKARELLAQRGRQLLENYAEWDENDEPIRSTIDPNNDGGLGEVEAMIAEIDAALAQATDITE